MQVVELQMEAVLLDLVLSGLVEVDQILPWTLQGGALPQSVSLKLSQHLEPEKVLPERPLQAAYFREAVFNTVRSVPLPAAGKSGFDFLLYLHPGAGGWESFVYIMLLIKQCSKKNVWY
jgi:hypothetical protein